MQESAKFLISERTCGRINPKPRRICQRTLSPTMTTIMDVHVGLATWECQYNKALIRHLYDLYSAWAPPSWTVLCTEKVKILRFESARAYTTRKGTEYACEYSI